MKELFFRALAAAVRPLFEWQSRAALLPTCGESTLPGLRAPVDVSFDDHGVPHVRASSDADAFRAQGYCHVRDRFFQMDLMRRVLRGRLSELIGARRLGDLALLPFPGDTTSGSLDLLLRCLDLAPAARRAWRQCDRSSRAALEAYTQGVNAALGHLRRRPLEHRLLRLSLEPWQPEDCLLLAKGMALAMGFKWRASPLFSAIASRLGGPAGESAGGLPDLLSAILPHPPSENDFATIARHLDPEHLEPEHLDPGADLTPLACQLPSAPLAGSNAWVVGGERSASGLPLLASDPHLALSLPGCWHLASLSGDRFQAVGAALPGVPGIVIGRTPSVAWGVTNAVLDDTDLWFEEVDSDGRHYRVDGAWRPLEIEPQVVHCRGIRSRTLHIRRTHRGPLISDAFPNYNGPPISIRLTLHEPGQELGAYLALGRSRTVEQALPGLRHFGAPAQNLFLADSTGRAVYRFLGRVPRRPAEDLDAPSDAARHPVLPRDGTRSASDWRGFVDPAELPALEIPPDGLAVSGNNAPVGPDYPHYLSCLFDPDYRARRIARVLDGRRGLTADDQERLQADAVSLVAERFHASVLAPHATAVAARRPALSALWRRILDWRGDEHAGVRGAVPWHLFYHHLPRSVFGARLGQDLLRRWMNLINAVDAPLLRAFEDPSSPWAPPAERVELLCRALEDVDADLRRWCLDPDMAWGDFHTLTLRHPLGGVTLLDRLYNRGPMPLNGGSYAVCSGQYPHSDPGPVQVGQTYRQVVDLGDPEAARMITFGGQCGYLGSSHYEDLTPLWQAGRSLPMRLLSAPETGSRLRLRPPP